MKNLTIELNAKQKKTQYAAIAMKKAKCMTIYLNFFLI